MQLLSFVFALSPPLFVSIYWINADVSCDFIGMRLFVKAGNHHSVASDFLGDSRLHVHIYIYLEEFYYGSQQLERDLYTLILSLLLFFGALRTPNSITRASTMLPITVMKSKVFQASLKKFCSREQSKEIDQQSDLCSLPYDIRFYYPEAR